MSIDRPNIIYIVCHDLGKHLGCYGVPVASPNLDRFAAGGVNFTNAFCSSTACSPSRGCAMSGQYAHTNGMMGLLNNGWSMPESTLTIVDYLNDAGYETAHFGFQHERAPGVSNRYQIEGPHGINHSYTEGATKLAIDYLENKKRKETPFYLNIGLMEVHASQWQGKKFPERAKVYKPVSPENAYVPTFMPDTPAIRTEMGKFQGAIRHMDSHIQDLFDAIKRLGYSDNTLVIFTTDHGMCGIRSKTTLYERGVEIALMLQMPGGSAEVSSVGHLIQNIDITPTLLDAVGAEIPGTIQGKSFWPLLTGGDYEPHERIFMERNYHWPTPPKGAKDFDRSKEGYDPTRSVRTPRFHYIRNFRENAKKQWLPGEVPYMNEEYDEWFDKLWPMPSLPRPKEELFDIENDPEEFHDLAADPQYVDTKNELAAHVDQWMRNTDDPLLKGPIPDMLNPWPEKGGV